MAPAKWLLEGVTERAPDIAHNLGSAADRQQANQRARQVFKARPEIIRIKIANEAQPAQFEWLERGAAAPARPQERRPGGPAPAAAPGLRAAAAGSDAARKTLLAMGVGVAFVVALVLFKMAATVFASLGR
jgi:hypothetical protein